MSSIAKTKNRLRTPTDTADAAREFMGRARGIQEKPWPSA